MPTPFKTCPSCGKSWKDRTSFLDDPATRAHGYLPDFDHLDSGVFFITHMVDDCQSTMGVTVSEFSDLYSGPRYKERRTLKEECPRYCKDQLSRCEAKCECAFVREVLHILANWPKKP